MSAIPVHAPLHVAVSAPVNPLIVTELDDTVVPVLAPVTFVKLNAFGVVDTVVTCHVAESVVPTCTVAAVIAPGVAELVC